MLDRALEAAGIARDLVYVTNTVKHFKWQPSPRGNRRIHVKPDTREIAACKPWLEAELAVLRPRLVVALGATAAQALTGKAFRVTQSRGVVLPLPPSSSIVTTVHPSSILRAPGPENRAVEFDKLMAGRRWPRPCRRATSAQSRQTHWRARRRSLEAHVLLREVLEAVGTGYDRHAGFNTPHQQLIRRAPAELSDYRPPEFVIKASGGQNPIGATSTPWIAFLDPEEADSPQQGLYVVWLLRADCSAWTLSVNMGTEKRAKRYSPTDPDMATIRTRERRVLEDLRAEANAIRLRMRPLVTAGWDSSIDLGGGLRQHRYEAATIIGRTYNFPALPPDNVLRRDLDHVCMALHEAGLAKRDIAAERPGFISTPSPMRPPRDEREYVFNPGSDRTSRVSMPARPVMRSTRHEGGLDRYGRWLIERGLHPATNVYPRDFIIAGTPEWLGEYKVVYGADTARATREAHSQLKEYRYFGYDSSDQVALLAVFSAEIPPKRVEWLNSEGIAVVWDCDGQWRGCPIARSVGLGE